MLRPGRVVGAATALVLALSLASCSTRHTSKATSANGPSTAVVTATSAATPNATASASRTAATKGRPKPGSSLSSGRAGTVGTSSTAAPGGSGVSGSGGSHGAAGSPSQPGSSGVPHFSHIVIVVLENKAYGQVLSGSTPFLDGLASSGALLTQSYAISHPSEPNYLALFSGSTQGLSSDSCPHQFGGPNLAASLIASGHSFTGYSESLPSAGFTGCSSGPYARKHNPWVNFTSLPSSVNQPWTAFPGNLANLPDVSFVIPNLNDDMHDGTAAEADQWLGNNLGGYASWTRAHNSLLIVTTDEDDDNHGNHITTIIAGAHVRAGQYAMHTDHYGLLHTVLASYGLGAFGGASSVPPLMGLWTS